MFFRKSLFLAAAIFLPAESVAGAFVQTGLHFGGDTLATVYYFGSDNESVEAGGLISGSVGYEADINELLLVKFSAGIKFDAVTATNGDIDFTRFPLTGMIFMKGDNVHFGVGMTQHTGVELTIDGFSSSANLEFDDATGFVMQLDYLLNERGYLSLTYTSIDYQPVNTSIEVDGSSIGILVGYQFGK